MSDDDARGKFVSGAKVLAASHSRKTRFQNSLFQSLSTAASPPVSSLSSFSCSSRQTPLGCEVQTLAPSTNFPRATTIKESISGFGCHPALTVGFISKIQPLVSYGVIPRNYQNTILTNQAAAESKLVRTG